MRNKQSLWKFAIFATMSAGVVLSTGCSSDGMMEAYPTPRITGKLPAEPADTSTDYVVWNNPSDYLAQHIPKFGGVYIKDGKFHMRMVGEDVTQAERDFAVATLTHLNDSVGGRKTGEVVFEPGPYLFTQFRIWELRLIRVYRKHNLYRSGVREDEAVIAAYVTRTEDSLSLTEDLPRLGIPSEAIKIYVQPAPRLAGNL